MKTTFLAGTSKVVTTVTVKPLGDKPTAMLDILVSVVIRRPVPVKKHLIFKISHVLVSLTKSNVAAVFLGPLKDLKKSLEPVTVSLAGCCRKVNVGEGGDLVLAVLNVTGELTVLERPTVLVDGVTGHSDHLKVVESIGVAPVELMVLAKVSLIAGALAPKTIGVRLAIIRRTHALTGEDETRGFTGFDCNTHGDLLAGLTGVKVGELLNQLKALRIAAAGQTITIKVLKATEVILAARESQAVKNSKRNAHATADVVLDDEVVVTYGHRLGKIRIPDATGANLDRLIRLHGVAEVTF